MCIRDRFNDKVATVKDEIVGIVGNRTVSILEVWPQEIYTMGSHFARGGSILYDMWGLKAPEAIQGPMVEGDEAYKVISVEALPDYAGDFICYGVLDGADSAYVDDSQLWKNLPAVKAGRLMPYEQVAFMHRDPITLTNQLEAFTDFFGLPDRGSDRGRAGCGALPVLRQHAHPARPGAGRALLA